MKFLEPSRRRRDAAERADPARARGHALPEVKGLALRRSAGFCAIEPGPPARQSAA